MKGTFYRNISGNTTTQAIVGYIKKSCPFCYRSGFALICNEAIMTVIIHLLNICRPSAIFWRIRARTVNTFNRVVWRRALAHVGKEIWKRETPALAHDDTATAIIRVYSTVRVIAAGMNPKPDTILRSFGHSMCGTHKAQSIRRCTTATCGMSAFYVRDSGSDLISAIAKTTPNSSTAGSDTLKSNDRQSVETLTSIIFDSLARKRRRIYHNCHTNIIPKGADIVKLAWGQL